MNQRFGVKPRCVRLPRGAKLEVGKVLSINEVHEKWSKFIEKARQFPDGVAAYCKLQGVSTRIYYYWFGILKPQHPEWYDLSKERNSKSNSAKTEGVTGSSNEVLAKTTRRTFSASKKKRILQEIDNAPSGGIAAILRREGLYSSQIPKWRAEFDGLTTPEKKRGPKPDPYAAENKKLRAENARLEKQLLKSQKIIEIQKKVSELLGVTLGELPDND